MTYDIELYLNCPIFVDCVNFDVFKKKLQKNLIREMPFHEFFHSQNDGVGDKAVESNSSFLTDLNGEMG